MGELSSWPDRASIFHLMRRSSGWTKAVVNAKKIPATLAGIFNFRPKPCWAGLRIQHSLASLTRHTGRNEQNTRLVKGGCCGRQPR